MTAPADAFRSGSDLVTLAPAGSRATSSPCPGASGRWTEPPRSGQESIEARR